MLPDVDFVMHEATQLFFNDMPWKSPEKDHIFVHEIVPLATAKNLGVQLCRSASLAKYTSIPGSHFRIMNFGPHVDLTRRIQNIIHDYPFDVTILKELLQNADDSGATKMYVILDKRQHSSEHIISEKWQQLQGPALLVWNDSVFSEKDLDGIQELGLGSKRSDADTIGQYGIGFNAVYHLTDCPSFLTGGDTLCVLDPHMRYVPEATDRYPGVMYKHLDDGFWNSFDGMKFPYLRDGLANRPKELLDGSLFRFPLRHTYNLAKSSDIVKIADLNDLQHVVISGKRMHDLLDEWAPKMKQSLFFLNNVTELKFFVIEDSRGVLRLQHSYRTELQELALKCRMELVQKIKAFSDEETREPFITAYPLMIIESLPHKGKDRTEEWLILQGIGDIEEKVKTWSYIKQMKPRHGIAAPLKQGQVPLYGQVFCFLPLPLHSGLPVHINGHFILDSTRRNLWVPTDRDSVDDKSRWNQNIMQAIASSYAHFLERITEYYPQVEGLSDRAILERDTNDYYTSFPRCSHKSSTGSDRTLSEPWLNLAKQVFQILAEHVSCVLAILLKLPSRSTADKYLLQWQPLKNEQLPSSQVHFWKETGVDGYTLRPILERVGMKITCAPLWIMNHFKDTKCEIPIISRARVFEFYTKFFQRLIDYIPCAIEESSFKSVEDFKHFTKFLLQPMTVGTPFPIELGEPQSTFPSDPFGCPLLLTDDNQLRIFDKANRVLCSKFAHLFPKCLDKFLHKDLLELTYSSSYFLSELDNEVSITVVKPLLETILPQSLKNMCVFPGSEVIKKKDLKNIWRCFSSDHVFKSVLPEVLKVWALLLTRDDRLLKCASRNQLLPIIPLAAEPSGSAMTYGAPSAPTNIEVSYALEKLPNTPFLDTEIVPTEAVSLLCPNFSDPKAMLKKLYYLHQDFPFTEAITVDIASTLLRYFQRINFREEMYFCEKIKCLPLFETIDGDLTPLKGKRMYVWPYDIC